MHRHEFLGPLPAPTLGLSVSHHRRDPPYPHPSLGRGVEVMRGAISVAITLSTILVVDGFIQPKLGRGVTLVSSRKSLCPSGIRPLIQTARPIKWRQENGPYGRGLCTCLMAADRKDDKPIKGAAPNLFEVPIGSEAEEALDQVARKELGDELYMRATEMAMKQRAFEDSKPDYGLEYPPYDEDTYPECVPAFTQTVSIGFIGQNLVGTPLLRAMMTLERMRLKEEFNIELCVRAVAEYGTGSGMMLLDEGGIDSFEQVNELWASKKSPIDVQKFADFLSEYDTEHKVIIECSGTMEQMSDQPEHWDMLAEHFESWAMQGFHILTADETDTEIAHYVLCGVMLNLDRWQELEQMWEDEEEKKGPNTEVFQEGTMEGKAWQILKEMSGFNATDEELRQQHIEMFGIDPEVAGEVKEQRFRRDSAVNARGQGSDRDGRGGMRGGTGKGGRGGRGGERGGGGSRGGRKSKR